MTHKLLLVLIVGLFWTHTAFAQFGQSSRQLNDEAQRLASEATALADASYSDYTRGFRSNRNDIQSVMLAYQFSSAAGLFNRMVNDRRRNAELRDAFQLLQSLSTSTNRGNLEQSRWSNIQQLMSEISRQLNLDTGNPPGFPDQGFPPSGSGRMTWRGTVDDDVRIMVRGGTAQVETIGGSPYYDAVTNFTASLPSRRVNVALQKRRGRGQIFIEQQPSRQNNFTAVIRIKDPRGGASDYEFDLSW